MINFLIFSVIALAIILIILILAQPSQEEGLSGLTGQSSVQQGSFFGKDKHSTLSFLTWFCFILFLFLSFLLANKSQKAIKQKAKEKSFLETVNQQQNSNQKPIQLQQNKKTQPIQQ